MSQVNITLNTNTVDINTTNNQIVVTDPTNPTTINVVQPVTTVVEVITAGPQGPPGPITNTGGLLTTASFNSYTGSSSSQFAGTSSFAISSSRAVNSLTASYVLPLNQTVSISGSLGITGPTSISTDFGYGTSSVALTVYNNTLGDEGGSEFIGTGIEAQGNIGVLGRSDEGVGVKGIATGTQTTGVMGEATQGTGVLAKGDIGLRAEGSTAIQAIGDVNIVGDQLLSGSLTISGSANITGNVTATSFTGSLFGTSSWAISASNAQTASYVLQAVSSSFAISSSRAVSASYSISASNAQTASYVLQAVSASYSSTSSYAAIAGNGGVTQLLAGPNITLGPTNGLGQVTISSTGGGGSSFNTATGSYGSFYSTVTQTNVASTARSMSLDITDLTNGVSISGSTDPFNTYIKTENAGIYNIQFSAQVDKTDSGTDEIWIWIRKNGTNLSDTATSVQLTGNGAHYVAAWNFFVNAAANDYFQLMWYSPDANVRLHAEPAFGVVPGIPSLIVTANRIDQFLSNTGSFSGSFTGTFSGSLFGTSSWATNAQTASYVNPLNQNVLITGSLTAGLNGNISDGVSFGSTPNVLIGMNTGSTGAVLDLRNTSGSSTAGDRLGTIQFTATSTGVYAASQIRATTTNGSSTGDSGGGNISILTSTGGAGVQPIERMRITSAGNTLITGSLIVTNGITGSFSGSGTNLNSILTTAIVGNFTQIATGSVTASVTPTQFSVVSGSMTEFVVTGTGVTIGGALTDTHRVTGSLNITGSLSATTFNGYVPLRAFKSGIDGATVTNTTTITATYSQLIPANTFAAGDVIDLLFRTTSPGAKTSISSNYVYLNTANNLSGTPLQLAIYTGGATTRTIQLERTLSIKGATTKFINPTGTIASDTSITGAMTTTTIDWTVDQYFIFAIGHSVADQTLTGDCYRITKN